IDAVPCGCPSVLQFLPSPPPPLPVGEGVRETWLAVAIASYHPQSSLRTTACRRVGGARSERIRATSKSALTPAAAAAPPLPLRRARGKSDSPRPSQWERGGG